jgi:uncharacterized protein (DUF362 family)
MDRRTFLRQLLLYSLGLSMSAPRFGVAATGAETTGAAELSLVSGADYSAVVRRALQLLGGMERFVRPGASVVVKPNIAWDRTPEYGATTHPLVVKTLVELALQAGAGEVRIFDHTCNEKRRCYVNSGIADIVGAMAERRVKLDYIDSRKFVEVKITGGRSLDSWEIYRDALTADCYINVPVAKHHGLSGLTLGLKNVMGVVGGNRGRLHHGLAQKLADLATVVRPTLTVIDATRLLLRNGPQGGRLEDVRQTDTVIASADPVAADAVATTLFGLEPERIETTVAAFQMGLGQMDPNRIHISEQRL